MTDNKKDKNIRIIGIDPGSTITGWGIIEEKSNVLSLVQCGAIKPKNTGKDNFSERLHHIYHALCEICQEFSPQEAAIEQVFVAKNALSALKLGQARGIAMAACMQHNMIVYDYEPTKVKQSLVGNGHATKEQVAFMAQTLLNIKKIDKPLDTTDAIAIAICHANTRRFLL